MHGSRLFIENHCRQRETHQKWCRRQDAIRQGVKKALLLGHSGMCLFMFPHRCLNKAQETNIEHDLAETHREILACECSLQLSFSRRIVFPLVRKKALKLVQEGSGHGAHEVIHKGVRLLYHLFGLRPRPLRSEQEDEPGVRCSQLVRLSAALEQRNAVSTHVMGTSYRSHPVGCCGQAEAALSCLRRIATRFCLCQQVLEKLDGRREVTPMKRDGSCADSTCSRLQAH